jgi:hypothetical protein
MWVKWGRGRRGAQKLRSQSSKWCNIKNEVGFSITAFLREAFSHHPLSPLDFLLGFI